jgi:hypothetical protein
MQKFLEVFLLNKKQGSSYRKNFLYYIFKFSNFHTVKIKFYVHLVRIL